MASILKTTLKEVKKKFPFLPIGSVSLADVCILGLSDYLCKRYFQFSYKLLIYKGIYFHFSMYEIVTY